MTTTVTKPAAAKPMVEIPGMETGNAPIPLVIGVTGHLAIHPAAQEDVRKQVIAIIKGLQKDYPHTPLLVLSPLAQGADQLAAEAALSCFDRSDRLDRLWVPLPMPENTYLNYFERDDAKKRFTSIKTRAHIFNLPGAPENADYYKDQANRDKQYAAVGAFIARHSQILIALWDGKPPNSKCGTASVVQYQLKGIPPPFRPAMAPLDIVENGPVYHVLTPRAPVSTGSEADDNNVSPGTRTLTILLPEREEVDYSWESYIRVLRHIENYNADLAHAAGKKKAWVKKVAKSADRLLPAKEREQLPGAIKKMIGAYNATDILAQSNQSVRLHVTTALFIAATLGLLALECFNDVHFFNSYPIMLAAYPLILFAAVIAAFMTKRKRIDAKHLDYRALAEGLRVLIFWRIAGIPDDIADHYLRKQQGVLEWIRYSLRTIDLFSSAGQAITAAPGGRHLVAEYWLKPQADFFTKKSQNNHRGHSRRDIVARSLFFTGLAIALGVSGVLLYQQIAKNIEFNRGLPEWVDYSIVLMTLFPAIAAAQVGYAEKLAMAAQARQYQRMLYIYRRARRELNKKRPNIDISDIHPLLTDLGKEALMENGDWVLLHRERPLEVPIGG